MNTPGFPAIARPWIPKTRDDLGAYLAALSVGALAAVAVSDLRMPLHLPGHKVLFWLAPALACRLVTRARAGAAVAALATTVGTLLMGGHLGGGMLVAPLLVLAGFIVDMAAAVVERHRLSWLPALSLLAVAGAAGNLACFGNRLFDAGNPLFGFGNAGEFFFTAGSYAFFGLFAGVCGTLVAWLIFKTSGAGNLRRKDDMGASGQ